MRYRSDQGFKLSSVLIIVIINVAVFILFMINSNLVVNLFGLQRASLLHQPWTIITNMFVHGGFSHIIFNMLTMYWFGTALVNMVGNKNFLLVYFCGGLLGNILFLLLAPSYAIAIGASGAVYALGGALVVMRPKVKVFIFPIPIPIPLWVAVLIGFVLSFVPGTAWQAHLGGLIFGAGAGYVFRRQERRYIWR